MIELERDSPAAAHWPQQEYEKLFVTTNSPQHAERLAWVVEDEAAEPAKTSDKAPEILAFLVGRRVDTDWELENIVVARAARLRGIGKSLLSQFVEWVRAERGRGIFLEVRESNQGARELYRRAGFEETGLRKSYYSNPAEDAIVCHLSLY
jgi:[ribosomal protein S18]-alanine N-acetyltransferase